jgi:hypothetical protein
MTKLRREKPKSIKSEMQKGRQQQISWECRIESETTLKAYTLINLKFLKKWIDFYQLMTIQN